MKKRQFFKFCIFFMIGLFILKWVYDIFGGQEAIDLIKKKKFDLYLLFFAHIPTLYLDSLAWYVLFKKNNKISLFWSFIITWISQSSGKFLPTGNITGEFVRVYLGTQKGLTLHASSSTTFADLILATFSLFLMAFFSFIFLITNYSDLIDSKNSMYIYLSLSLILFGCIFFYWFVRKRLLIYSLKKFGKIFKIQLQKKNLNFLIKLDFSLYQLSKNKFKVLNALGIRLLGWLAGAFEIYVFLFIIGVDASVLDVVIIESFSGIIRAIAFFIPAGLGVQELAFVMIGEYVGFGSSVSFSMALGRRIREILVGFPAIIAWVMIFKKDKKKGSSIIS